MGAATATAVIGLVASAGQAIYSNEQKKKAESRAQAARNRAAGITEANPFESLQAPDVSRLAFDETSQAQAEALQAAQGLGEAGAAQVTGIVKAAQDQKLRAAAAQAKQNYERDALQARGESGIESRRAERQSRLELASVQANMQAAQQAQANTAGAVMGAFDSAGALATGIQSDKNKTKGLDTDISEGSVVDSNNNPTFDENTGEEDLFKV